MRGEIVSVDAVTGERAADVIVVLGVIPGQRGRNRFGPNTKPAPPEATPETCA